MSSRVRIHFIEPASALSDARTYQGNQALRRIEELWSVNVHWLDGRVPKIPPDYPRWRRCAMMVEALFGPKSYRVLRQRRRDGFNSFKARINLNAVGALYENPVGLIIADSPWDRPKPKAPVRYGRSTGAIPQKKEVPEAPRIPVSIWK